MTHQIIIDGTNAIMGRLSSYVAKQALRGKKVVIVNSEKVIITGKKQGIVGDYHQRRRRGGSSQRWPLISKLPERLLKRAIRGMLPHKEGKGREALKRVICYKGIPAEFEKEKMIKAGKEKTCDFAKLGDISKEL